MRHRRLQTTHRNDWLGKACQAIVNQEQLLDSSSRYVCERLAALLIGRLPAKVSRPLVEMLPDPPGWMSSLVQPGGDPSIGYSDFLEGAMDALALEITDRSIPEPELEQAARRVVDLFLNAVSAQLPRGAMEEISYVLPPGATRADLPPEPELKRAS